MQPFELRIESAAAAAAAAISSNHGSDGFVFLEEEEAAAEDAGAEREGGRRRREDEHAVLFRFKRFRGSRENCVCEGRITLRQALDPRTSVRQFLQSVKPRLRAQPRIAASLRASGAADFELVPSHPVTGLDEFSSAALVETDLPLLEVLGGLAGHLPEYRTFFYLRDCAGGGSAGTESSDRRCCCICWEALDASASASAPPLYRCVGVEHPLCADCRARSVESAMLRCSICRAARLLP